MEDEEGQRRKKQEVIQWPPTSSLLGNSHVYGTDAGLDKAVYMLLSPRFYVYGMENVSVVSIVGMGGMGKSDMGKTTLVQLVNNDDKIKNYFEARMWVCVSYCFYVLRLTREILKILTGETTELQKIHLLQEKLHKYSKGKRFLPVLDDLWNEILQQWAALWNPLSGGAKGSKVLVATQSKNVSRISSVIHMHCLKGWGKMNAGSGLYNVLLGARILMTVQINCPSVKKL